MARLATEINHDSAHRRTGIDTPRPTNDAWPMILRDEVSSAIEAIRELVTAAFRTAPHSNGSEAAIVEALRADGELTILLVADEQGKVVGHVAYSPVSIDGTHEGWLGLGPIAVTNSLQRRGIGRRTQSPPLQSPMS